jgi:hypothetical protein
MSQKGPKGEIPVPLAQFRFTPESKHRLSKAYYTKEDIEKYKDALVCLGCPAGSPKISSEKRLNFSRWTSALLQRSLQ